MFNIDIKKLVFRLLPPFLRGDLNRAWIETLLKPFAVLVVDFNVFRDEKISELSYSGQSIQLERYLNDVFDKPLRRIRIKHYSDQPDFDYLLSENGTIEDYDYLKSENVAPGFIYLIGENTTTINTDFVVQCPASLSAAVAAIKARVDRYRVAGRRYTVEFI